MEYHNPNDYWMPDLSGLTEEEKEEVMETSLLCGCGMHVVLAIVLLVLMLFSSCTTTKYVPVVEHKTDTLIQTKLMHDSVWLHDSIVQKQKEDTVIYERWHTRLAKKEIHDTTYISKVDSVPVPYPVVKEVEKELTWWQKLRIHVGDVMLIALLGGVVYIVGRRKLRIWW